MAYRRPRSKTTDDPFLSAWDWDVFYDDIVLFNELEIGLADAKAGPNGVVRMGEEGIIEVDRPVAPYRMPDPPGYGKWRPIVRDGRIEWERVNLTLARQMIMQWAVG